MINEHVATSQFSAQEFCHNTLYETEECVGMKCGMEGW